MLTERAPVIVSRSQIICRNVWLSQRCRRSVLIHLLSFIAATDQRKEIWFPEKGEKKERKKCVCVCGGGGGGGGGEQEEKIRAKYSTM